MQVRIPSGRTHLLMEADPHRVLTSGIGRLIPTADGETLVREAMEHPIGTPRLSDLARDKRTCTVIISDHTRPVPSRQILPPMLEQLREGNPKIEITLLVATGCHRPTSGEELRRKLGEEIYRSERIVIHDAFGEGNVEIGTLPSGAPLVVDRVAVETDLLVAEGFIEPHFFAGFSGGRKSVLPGVCDAKTVWGNHCGAFIDSPYARTGILEGNPIHRDMEYAAAAAGLAYVVNVVIGEDKETVAAFAGDFRLAHREGVDFLRAHCGVPAVPADVVVTGNGGFPLDQNLYQCVKCMTAAEATAREGGTVIVCAGLEDGMGGDDFYADMRDCETPAALYERLATTPQSETKPDAWQTQVLCRILMHHPVIVVTRPEMRDAIEEMKMAYAPTLESALEMAGQGEVTVIPDGVSVIVGTEPNV